ncbi:hypothetical protein Tco_0987994 [Tanacetum coccineum]|uniref:Uncharacterized protein n=1 Tax=Tanacetum coccineum TaxID=301880 RepID=A0ABQ5EPW5_9ASTR
MLETCVGDMGWGAGIFGEEMDVLMPVHPMFIGRIRGSAYGDSAGVGGVRGLGEVAGRYLGGGGDVQAPDGWNGGFGRSGVPPGLAGRPGCGRLLCLFEQKVYCMCGLVGLADQWFYLVEAEMIISLFWCILLYLRFLLHSELSSCCTDVQLSSSWENFINTGNFGESEEEMEFGSHVWGQPFYIIASTYIGSGSMGGGPGRGYGNSMSMTLGVNASAVKVLKQGRFLSCCCVLAVRTCRDEYRAQFGSSGTKYVLLVGLKGGHYIKELDDAAYFLTQNAEPCMLPRNIESSRHRTSVLESGEKCRGKRMYVSGVRMGRVCEFGTDAIEMGLYRFRTVQVVDIALRWDKTFGVSVLKTFVQSKSANLNLSGLEDWVGSAWSSVGWFRVVGGVVGCGLGCVGGLVALGWWLGEGVAVAPPRVSSVLGGYVGGGVVVWVVWCGGVVRRRGVLGFCWVGGMGGVLFLVGGVSGSSGGGGDGDTGYGGRIKWWGGGGRVFWWVDGGLLDMGSIVGVYSWLDRGLSGVHRVEIMIHFRDLGLKRVHGGEAVCMSLWWFWFIGVILGSITVAKQTHLPAPQSSNEGWGLLGPGKVSRICMSIEEDLLRISTFRNLEG